MVQYLPSMHEKKEKANSQVCIQRLQIFWLKRLVWNLDFTHSHFREVREPKTFLTEASLELVHQEGWQINLFIHSITIWTQPLSRYFWQTSKNKEIQFPSDIDRYLMTDMHISIYISDRQRQLGSTEAMPQRVRQGLKNCLKKERISWGGGGEGFIIWTLTDKGWAGD